MSGCDVDGVSDGEDDVLWLAQVLHPPFEAVDSIAGLFRLAIWTPRFLAPIPEDSRRLATCALGNHALGVALCDFVSQIGPVGFTQFGDDGRRMVQPPCP